MKRSILKKLNLKRKLAVCAILAGLSTFSVGFTGQDEVEISEPVITVESHVETSTIKPNEIILQASEFVNTATREAVVKTPEEVSVVPIGAIDNAEDLTYEDNYEEEFAYEDDYYEEETANSDDGFNYVAVMSMEATAYLPSDGGGYGITAIGIPASYGVVAVDPGVIPLGSRLYIPGYGEAIAADTGGAIYGYRIDLCMESYAEAMNFGRRVVTVYVLD